jgi:L-ascorbate metabolism protein UlaG (beta-lactamase superfamily)
MALKDNTIWHLAHSSFAMKVDGKLFIFDYFMPESERQGGGMAQGFIDPQEIRDEETYVFNSHSHGDHFNGVVFDWQEVVGDITYVMSSDIRDTPTGALTMEPFQETELEGMRVKAYPATDAGVAFSIFVGDMHIYHAGDNAYWNWQDAMPEEAYVDVLSAIDLSRPVDVAFMLCDPRLKGLGEGGTLIFARTIKPRLLVPMHAFGDYEINQNMSRIIADHAPGVKFWPIQGRGESYPL